MTPVYGTNEKTRKFVICTSCNKQYKNICFLHLAVLFLDYNALSSSLSQ